MANHSNLPRTRAGLGPRAAVCALVLALSPAQVAANPLSFLFKSLDDEQPASATNAAPQLSLAAPEADAWAARIAAPGGGGDEPSPVPAGTLAAAPAPAAPVGRWTTWVIEGPGVSASLAIRKPTLAARPASGLNGATHALSGQASYYWQDQMTATGERFDKRALTAAHKTLPFGTRVRVTRLDTGQSVIVRINDRGPYKPGRIIDLSERAAEQIHMTGVGVTPVQLDVLPN